MIGGTHLVGIGDLNRYLTNRGDVVPKDGNGTPVTQYIELFNDYETPFTLPDSLKKGIIVAGGSGPDKLNGFEGDDTISGKKGDDIINGGEGFDIARYEGNGDEYEIEFLPDDTVRITDRVGARDGSDTLKDVEQAVFSDKTIDISPGQDISFVIDTTGSMDDDIDAVKARASEIINTIRTYAKTPYIAHNNFDELHYSHVRSPNYFYSKTFSFSSQITFILIEGCFNSSVRYFDNNPCLT